MADTKFIADAVVIGIVAAKGVLDTLGGRRRDKHHSASLDSRFADLALALEKRFSKVDAAITEVSNFCIGPDGQNGMRSQINAILQRISELERRPGTRR